MNLKLDRKDAMYGLIILLLLMSVAFTGQITNMMLLDNAKTIVKDICESKVYVGEVSSITPFGITFTTHERQFDQPFGKALPFLNGTNITQTNLTMP